MQRKTISLVLVLVGLVILAVGIFSYYIPPTTQNESRVLEQSDRVIIELNLEGGVTKCSMTVLQGNEGTRVFVKDSQTQEIVYDGGIVYSDLEFSFEPQHPADYFFTFENISPNSQQTIEYSITYPTNIPKIISIITIIGGLVILLQGVILISLKRKKA